MTRMRQHAHVRRACAAKWPRCARLPPGSRPAAPARRPSRTSCAPRPLLDRIGGTAGAGCRGHPAGRRRHPAPGGDAAHGRLQRTAHRPRLPRGRTEGAHLVSAETALAGALMPIAQPRTDPAEATARTVGAPNRAPRHPAPGTTRRPRTAWSPGGSRTSSASSARAPTERRRSRPRAAHRPRCGPGRLPRRAVRPAGPGPGGP